MRLTKDPIMRIKDIKKEISRITEAINELSARVLVVTSVQQGGRHSDPFCVHSRNASTSFKTKSMVH